MAVSSEPLTLRLDTLTYGGDALGRVDGRAIFVTGGLPGELVRVAITEERKNFARGRVLDVIESSPDRTCAALSALWLRWSGVWRLPLAAHRLCRPTAF